MGVRLLATVVEGKHGRIYLSPDPRHEAIANQATPWWKPDASLPNNPRDVRPQLYGMPTFGDLFTPRQLVALTTFSDLVGEARERVQRDAVAAGLADDGRGIADGGTGVTAYADAVATYLGLAIGKAENLWSSLVSWMNDRGAFRETFARQALPMVWDFAEANPFSQAGGNLLMFVERIVAVLEYLPTSPPGKSSQADASRQHGSGSKWSVTTDPPYL
jgi:putative DNA methylase